MTGQFTGQVTGQRESDAPRRPSELTTLFQPGELGDYVGFVARAARRRSILAVFILLLFASATVALIALVPRRYRVEGRLFAMPVEGTPGAVRGNNGEPIGLAQGAAEVIVTHQNLADLIREGDLVARWDAARPPLLRLLDRARVAVGATKPLDAEAKERALIGYLRKKLVVQVKGPDVFISVDWPEPRTAYEVIKASQKRFLVVRRAAELIPLERKVATVEAAATASQKRVDALAEQVDSAVKNKRHGAKASTVRGLQAEGRFRDLPDPQLSRQRLQIIAQRKAIAELEDARRKRLTELNATLAEQRAVLARENPAIVETEDKIRAVEAQNGAIEQLRAQEQDLLAAYVSEGGKESELSQDPLPTWPTELKEDDESIAYGKARIAMELSALQQLLGQLAEAQVTLASARASFDSRYMIVIPAEEPEEPIAPRFGLLMTSGLVAGVLLAIVGAVMAELRGGIIRESWQVDRQLELAVLAEVPDP
jgi:uncharacterized protein involved in exopolysaccharide biosynthesis